MSSCRSTVFPTTFSDPSSAKQKKNCWQMKIQLAASRSIRRLPRTIKDPTESCGYNSEAAGVDLVSLPSDHPNNNSHRFEQGLNGLTHFGYAEPKKNRGSNDSRMVHALVININRRFIPIISTRLIRFLLWNCAQGDSGIRGGCRNLKLEQIFFYRHSNCA